jgi:hypothetical protein
MPRVRWLRLLLCGTADVPFCVPGVDSEDTLLMVPACTPFTRSLFLPVAVEDCSTARLRYNERMRRSQEGTSVVSILKTWSSEEASVVTSSSCYTADEDYHRCLASYSVLLRCRHGQVRVQNVRTCLLALRERDKDEDAREDGVLYNSPAFKLYTVSAVIPGRADRDSSSCTPVGPNAAPSQALANSSYRS